MPDSPDLIAPVNYLVEPLAEYHDRKSFSCGEPEIDAFLVALDLASWQAEQAHVLVRDSGSPEIIAYYLLTPDPPPLLLAIPAEDEVQHTALHLRCLAVDRRYQRRGIGEAILIDLIAQILEVSEQHPVVDSLMLYALHERAKRWYLRRGLGFREVSAGQPYLILPVTTMKQAAHY